MSTHDIHTTDVLVIGAGLAGERAAIEAAVRGMDVTVLSLVPPRRSHSTAAQGGMQAALGHCAMGDGDCPDTHFLDTVKGSDWGAEQDVVRYFVDKMPEVVREMAFWGVPWNRVEAGQRVLPDGREIFEREDKAGLINARDFGGVAKWRCCYTSDGTGHSLQYTVDSIVVKLGVTVHDRVEALVLIHDGVRCFGALARCLRTGRLKRYIARSTVIATGGYGRLYAASTNAVINEGTGMALALNTGVVPLGNMEAVQFHPTGMVPTWILITEGARGDGGYLLDKDEYRFMPDYEPGKKELASRDVVSRRMVQHMRAGKGVESDYGQHLWLDIRHLDEAHIKTNLREIYNICLNFGGIDPIKELIPVRPTQHYSMGGVRTNIRCEAHGLKGLFAAGEAGCWDMHGFNRLGGNSLAETLVTGVVVGESATEWAESVELDYPSHLVNDEEKRLAEKIEAVISGKNGKENVYELRDIMGTALLERVGIFRMAHRLEKAVEILQEVLERSKNVGLRSSGKGANPELGQALKLEGMVRIALSIAYGALKRTESRGSHFREDFPDRDDENWLTRTLAYWDEGATLPRLEYEPVTITELPPGDRGYGEAAVPLAEDAPLPEPGSDE